MSLNVWARGAGRSSRSLIQPQPGMSQHHIRLGKRHKTLLWFRKWSTHTDASISIPIARHTRRVGVAHPPSLASPNSETLGYPHSHMRFDSLTEDVYFVHVRVGHLQRLLVKGTINGGRGSHSHRPPSHWTLLCIIYSHRRNSITRNRA